MEYMEEFKNVISLGANCLVAGNLERYGLRSFSGPFDWMVTEKYELVISMIEEDFKNYLQRENLEKIPNMEFYRDTKYRISYIHDDMITQEDYECCYAKYQRRIEKFREAVKEKTLFVRHLWNQEDIDYAVKDNEHILKVLRRHCHENEVIYIIRKDLDTESNRALPIKLFTLNADTSFKERLEGQEYTVNGFKTNRELEQFFSKDIAFSEIERYKNVYHYCMKPDNDVKRYHILVRIARTDFSKVKFPQEVVIYSAGNISRALYEKIKSMTTVKCFIDTRAKAPIDEIPIVIPSEYSYDENLPIIVTVTYDYEKVVNDLRRIYHVKGEIISLEEFLR